MKKFLALVLALIMTMSLVTISAGAEFTDADEVTYDEAVEVMTALGVVTGDTAGAFNPTKGLTRGAAAKIICNMVLGTEVASALEAQEAPFVDVATSNVFAGYIGFCKEEGIIGGYPDGTFKPADPLTGYAFLKMLLGALGYDADVEGFNSSNYAINVAKVAKQRGLTTGNDDYKGSAAITREEAMLYAFNTMKSQVVEYSGQSNSTITIGDIVIKNNGTAEYDGNDFFYEANFGKLRLLGASASAGDNGKMEFTTTGTDDFGRPAYSWKLNGESDPIGTYAMTADLSYTAKVVKEDLVDDLDALDLELPANGVVAENKNAAGESNFDFDTLADDEKYGATGTLVELFDTDADDVIDLIVWVDTYLGQVSSFTKDKTTTTKVDERTIVTTAGTIKAADETCDNFDALYNGLEKEDYVLITKAGTKVMSAVVPETIEGVVSKVNASSIVVDGATYALAAQASPIAVNKNSQTIWLDTYGNAIKGEVTSDASDVVYIAKVYTAADKYGTDTYYAQVVTAAGEVVELLMATPSATENNGMSTSSVGAYTYTTNSDGEAVFTGATSDEYAVISTGSEIKADAAKVAGKYVTSDVVMVYVKDAGADLKVTTANGVQKVASTAANSFVVLNDDGQAVAIFVLDAADTAVAAEDLVYVADNTQDGTQADLKGNTQKVYNMYVAGEKTPVMMPGAPTLGWNKYSVASDTNIYTLTAVGAAEGAYEAYFNAADINLDKYVAFDIDGDAVLEDLGLDADCAIYDLTENDLNTLAAIDDMMEIEGAKSVALAFTYDEDAEVITSIYVTEVIEAAPVSLQIFQNPEAGAANRIYVQATFTEETELAIGDLTFVLRDGDEEITRASNKKAFTLDSSVSFGIGCSFMVETYTSSSWTAGQQNVADLANATHADLYVKGALIDSIEVTVH